MSLIDKWNSVRDLSEGEKEALTKQQMRQMIFELFEQMKLTYFRGQQLVYQNPLGLSPEEVIEGFGDDAFELIRLSTLLKDVLNIVAPGTIPGGDDPYGDPYLC